MLACHDICLHGRAGTMCYKHWRDKRLNPSGFRVVSREYPHEPVAMYKDLRCTSSLPCRYLTEHSPAKQYPTLLHCNAPAAIFTMQS